MKIYLFNPETGVYLGEDFADEAPMRRGAFIVPTYATTIEPPQLLPGQLLVFNADRQRWEVHNRTTMALPMPIKGNAPEIFTRRIAMKKLRLLLLLMTPIIMTKKRLSVS